MSEDTPRPSDAVDPDVLDAETDPTDATDPEADSGGLSVKSMLLETEPSERPSEYEEPDHMAHFIIGAKKVLNSLLDGEVKRGTTAAENFMRGGLALVRESSEGEESSEPEEQRETGPVVA